MRLHMYKVDVSCIWQTCIHVRGMHCHLCVCVCVCVHAPAKLRSIQSMFLIEYNESWLHMWLHADLK